MRVVYPGDNRYVGAIAAAGHPAFPHLVYIAYRRDERDSQNFRKVHIAEYNRQTDQYRDIKRYDNGEPMGPAAIAVLGDGSLYVGLCWGMDDASVVFADDIIPNACPPFTAAGAWTVVQNAQDIDARRMAGDANKNASEALLRTQATSKQLDNTFSDLRAKVTKDVLATLGGTSVKLDDPGLLNLVWTKAGDRIYAEAMNPNSALSNVIVQRVKAALKSMKLIA